MEINVKGKQNEKLKGPDFQQPSLATQIPPKDLINRGINTVLRQQEGGETETSWEGGIEAGPLRGYKKEGTLTLCNSNGWTERISR